LEALNGYIQKSVVNPQIETGVYEYVYEYGASTPAPLILCQASLPGNEHPHGIHQEPFALHRLLLQFPLPAHGRLPYSYTYSYTLISPTLT
jgi:hypothetical protein